MTSITFFFILIPVLGLVLLGVNFLLAPHSPYEEKNSAFECGFHSFLGQNRSQFSISFFIFGLLFLLFDLEILLIYPFAVTAKVNDIYGLSFMLIFFLLLTLGFVFELGKQALKIDSRQTTQTPSLKIYSKRSTHTSTLKSEFFVKIFYRFKSVLTNPNFWKSTVIFFSLLFITKYYILKLTGVNITTDYLTVYSLIAYLILYIIKVKLTELFPLSDKYENNPKK